MSISKSKSWFADKLRDDARPVPVTAIPSTGIVLSAGAFLAADRHDEDGNHGSPTDLLLRNVVMPALGGFEVAAPVRARRPDIKVVFTSGYPNRGDAKHGGIPRDSQFLQKPLKANRPAQAVRDVLDETAMRLAG